MNDDIWGTQGDPSEEPDPVVADALRSMVPPPHGYGFWADLENRLAAEGNIAPTTAGPVAPPPPAQAPPPPPVPPLAEVVPLQPARPGPQRWLAAVAAVVVVALGIAALVRTTSTDVETTPAATNPPVEPSVAPTTAAMPLTTVPAVTAPHTVKPAAPSTTVSRSTTTRPAGLTLSPEGIGPLRLGMTTQQAEATGAVGPFDDALDTGGACGTATAAGTYRTGDFAVLYLDGRLARFYVSPGSRVRTPQGVGVGSPASKLSTVPGTRVESPHPYGGGTNVDITTGDVGYQFTVDQGTVREWAVGTKEALALPEGCA